MFASRKQQEEAIQTSHKLEEMRKYQVRPSEWQSMNLKILQRKRKLSTIIFTLCRLSMSLSCFFNSVKAGLSSGSFCQHLIMIWYLEFFIWNTILFHLANTKHQLMWKSLYNISCCKEGERLDRSLQFIIHVLWFRHSVALSK